MQHAYIDQDFDAWPLYEAIKCPTMLIHGALSDLVSTETATGMTQRSPRALLKIVEGVGHAPMFMTEDQITLVRDFLDVA